MVNRNTEQADFSVNLSFPVPKRTLIQLSFCGAPRINKSYPEDVLDIVSMELSDFLIITSESEITDCKSWFEFSIVFLKLSSEISSDTTRSNENEAP